jgi:thiol-disulfide isomerase/thioredoxin
MFFATLANAANIGEVKSISHWHKVYQLNASHQIVEYYFTDWCIYCPSQTAIIEELARENPHVLFVKLNADKFRRPGIRSFPTVMISGKIFSGLTAKSTIQSYLRPRPPARTLPGQTAPTRTES